MATQRVYQIVDWRKFEKSQAKDCRKFKWVAVPISFRGAGYCNLMERPDGPTMLGVWHAIMGLSADEEVCQQRWVLATTRGALSARRVYQVTMIDPQMFEQACEVLSQPDIHWLHAIDWDFANGLPPRYEPEQVPVERQLSLLDGDQVPAAPAATEPESPKSPILSDKPQNTGSAAGSETGSATGSDTGSATASLHVHVHGQLQRQLQPMGMSRVRAKSEATATAREGPPPEPGGEPDVPIDEAKQKGHAALLALVPATWPLSSEDSAYLRGVVGGVIDDAWPEGGCREARAHIRRLGNLVSDGFRRAKAGEVESPLKWAKARFNDWRQGRRRDRPAAGQPRGLEATAIGDLVGAGLLAGGGSGAPP